MPGSTQKGNVFIAAICGINHYQKKCQFGLYTMSIVHSDLYHDYNLFIIHQI